MSLQLYVRFALSPHHFSPVLDSFFLMFCAANPTCEEVGCGVWKPSMIQNPAHKGKWKPSLINNPDYSVSHLLSQIIQFCILLWSKSTVV